MTYKDLVKRLSLVLDGDKMLIWSDGEGWSNLEIEIRENDRIEGCREREEVFCPVCNELVTEVFTSGFPTVKVLEQKD